MALNLGVIGTGAIGREHIRRCSKVLVGAKVVAVNDINHQSAVDVITSLQLDAQVYDDAHELVKASNVNAILFKSWGPSHEEFVLAAIAAGKPVFCEKPLAVTAAGCKRIVDAEIKHGKRLVQVGFMRPFDRGYRALKEVIDSGEIGEPLMLHCAHRNASVADTYSTDMAIVDTLIHEINVLSWLLNDDYRTVQVVFPRKTSKALAHLRDPQVVLFETHKGTRIDVEVFVNCQYGYDIQCEVVGETGIARLPEPSSVQTRSQARLSTSILTDWKDRFIEAYDIELQAFIHDLAAGELTGPSAWDGYTAAVTSDACILAQENGQIVPIELPQRPAFYAR